MDIDDEDDKPVQTTSPTFAPVQGYFKLDSTMINTIYKSRKTLLDLLDTAGYDIEEHRDFTFNDIFYNFQHNRMDLMFEAKDIRDTEKHKRKIYVKYHDVSKTLRPGEMMNYIEDLFDLEEVLKKSHNDTLVIILREDPNDSLAAAVQNLYDAQGIFVVLFSLARLQFNILEHVLVPKHRILNSDERATLKKRYNLSNDFSELPTISRYDPVAMAVFMRPGDICHIDRDSKTTCSTDYYRICI